MNVLMLLTKPFISDPRACNEATALINSGHNVVVVSWARKKNSVESEKVDGVHVININVAAGYAVPKQFVKGMFLFYLKALRAIRGLQVSVVHAHDFDTLPLGIIIRRRKKARLVYDAHDDYSSMINDVLPTFISRLIGFLEKILIRFTDARIAATPALGKVVFGKKDHVVVMNCKDLTKFDLAEEEIKSLRATINPDNRFLIVYIGTLKVWTILPYLIEAAKKIGKGVRLVIGGSGPHRDEILKMIEGCENISYLGWVEPDKVPAYTLVSDVIVLVSDNRKRYARVSVATKILEGMAAGKPIIAGAETEAGRIVRECNNGFLCLYGDVDCLCEKLKLLMSDRTLYEKMCQNSRRCAEKAYNWAIMKKRFLSVYQALCEDA